MKELTLLATLAGSLLAGILFRVVVTRFRSSANAESVGSLFEAAALKFLLPLFVYEALSSAGLGVRSMAPVLAGAALPLSCLLVAWLCSRRSKACIGVPFARETTFLAASFGGGNRGTAMLLLVFAGSPDFDAYLQAFVLADLGNFLVLLLVVPLMLTHVLGSRDVGTAVPWWRLALRSYFATGAVLVLACYAVAALWTGWSGWLGDTADTRKAAFSVLVFFALGVRLSVNSPDALQALPRSLAFFLVIRGVAAIGVLCAMWVLGVSSHLIVAIGVLFAMPPSSLLPVLATRARLRTDSLGFLARFSVVCNLVYLSALAVAGLAVWVSQFSHGGRL